MPHGTLVYRFGDFELHPHAGRLLRAGRHIRLGSIPLAILVRLIAAAPQVVEKDALTEAGWGGTASLTSLEKAISRLRQALEDRDGSRYVETVPFRGYRLIAPVDEIDSVAAAAHQTRDQPFRRFEDARRELATLSRQAITTARQTLEAAVASAPNYAPGHAMLAMACALAFEASRFDVACDLAALAQAVDHARRALALDADCADGWSALGFALHLQGETDDAVAKAHTAVALDPGTWRHRVRLAFVSWGDARLEAAQSALRLRPELAIAHWLRATVFIARRAFDSALSELREGCAAQDAQPPEEASYPGVGLHLLRGHVLVAQGRPEEAIADFETELAGAGRGQMYANECSANTWYALGALRLQHRNHREAEAAFRQALAIAPGHLFSMAALGQPCPARHPSDPRVMDGVIARAVALARGNRHRDAMQIYMDGLAASARPREGWILPVEPILQPLERGDIWAPVLQKIRQRAT